MRNSAVTGGESLLGCMMMAHLTHPIVSRLAPMMTGDLDNLHKVVAKCVLESPTAKEKAALRYFGAELGAVQRRIRSRLSPPTEEEIEIALTAVLALVHRRTEPKARLS